MDADLYLPRKWTIRAYGRQIVLAKRRNERTAHVLMKALLWALYLPEYPQANIEVAIGDRYKPDVVELDKEGRPRFWGEAGQVSVRKIESLVRRYPQTHFAIAKWETRLDPHVDLVRRALNRQQRGTRFDLIAFPADSATRFVDSGGVIHITHDDVDWVREGA